VTGGWGSAGRCAGSELWCARHPRFADSPGATFCRPLRGLASCAEASRVDTQHSALSTQHSKLSTQHSKLSTQHSKLSTQHSKLRTQHSKLSTHHSKLITHHSPLTLSALRTPQPRCPAPPRNLT